MIVSKWTQLNAITDIWHPLYHEDAVLIDINKIKRSKLDIKLRFEKVGEDSGYAGNWFIKRKDALKYRKIYDNNGRKCLKIPFKEFEKLEISDKDLRAVI